MRELFRTLPSEPPYIICAPDLKRFEVLPDKSGTRFRVSPNQTRDENNRVRTELRIWDPAKKSKVFLVDPDGVESWSAVEFTIPDRWQLDPNKVVIHQCHHKGGPVSGAEPPMQVFLWNANLYIREAHALAGSTSVVRKDLYKKAFLPGHRYRLVMRKGWDTKGRTGRMAAWLDGRKLFEYLGVTGYWFAPGTYESVGMYWPSPTAGLTHDLTYHLWEKGASEIKP